MTIPRDQQLAEFPGGEKQADLLAREQAIRVAAESRAAELTAIIQSIPDAVYIGNAQGITMANEPALKMLGFDKPEDLNNPIEQLSERIHVRDAETGKPLPVSRQVFAKALQGQTTSSEVIVRDQKTGEDRLLRSTAAPIIVGGEVTGAVAVHSDITESRRAIQSSRTNEQRLKMALRAANAGTWDWDILTNEQAWSEEFYLLHGIKRGKAASAKTWQAVVHPDDRPLLSAERLIKSSNADEIDLEYRITRDDEPYWINVKGQILRDEDDRPVRMIGIAFDTTGRKRAEEALRVLADMERDRAQALAELDRFRDAFLAVASHELRNPLATIKGYTQMLERNLRKMREEIEDATLEKAMGRQSHYVEQAIRQIDRMSGMLNQLFDLASAQNQQLTLNTQPGVDIVQLVLRIVAEQRLNHLDRVIEVETTERLLEGDWDEVRLEQVLNNLIGNAIKYSPDSAPVLITVDCLSAGEEGRQTDEALVAVCDQGCGISADDQNHIFERFYRAHTPSMQNVKGLGVGLYISAEIVRLHKGRIWVTSTPNQGSTFYVALPCQQS